VEATLLKMARNAGDKWLKTARDAFCFESGKRVLWYLQHESEERILEARRKDRRERSGGLNM